MAKQPQSKATIEVTVNGLTLKVEGDQELVSKAMDFAMKIGAGPIQAALAAFARGQQ